MHKMQIDVEQTGFALSGANYVVIPNFFEESSWHQLKNVLSTLCFVLGLLIKNAFIIESKYKVQSTKFILF